MISEILKKLLPGFLPLLVFIIADEIWGTKTALVVAITIGVIEFLFTYIKTKKADRFILFDTLLLILLGGISLLMQNDIFFKLKPAFIELILCLLLGLSVYGKKNLVILMSKRYMKEIEINETQSELIKKSLMNLFWIFSFHTILIVYSAFFMSEKAWAFISTALFYILFFVYLIFEFIKLKHKNKINNQEYFTHIDENGKIIGKINRQEAHDGTKKLHPVVHLHVFNSQKELYLQKRSMQKDTQPGKWDTSVGGHISFGEKPEDALIRESMEEIGLNDFNPEFLINYIWESDIEREMVFVFKTVVNNKLLYNKTEIDEARYWSVSEIRKNLNKEIFTPNFEMEFKKILKLN